MSLFKIFGQKLKGGAMYMAILISVIICVLMNLFFWLTHQTNNQSASLFQRTQLYYNVLSGYEIAKSINFDISHNGIWLKNNFNNDSIKVSKSAWGAYEIIKVTTKNLHHQLFSNSLFGTYLSGDTALIVAENGRPIGLSGRIVFLANCYLPQASTKPSNVEGLSYIPAHENNKFIKKSPAKITEPSTNFFHQIESLRNYDLRNDSLASGLNYEVNNSFSNKTLTYLNQPSVISNVKYSNNVKIITDEITIDNSCIIDNILIICNKAHFKKKFKGSVHVFARDSIICEPDCEFTYPSSFILMSETGNHPKSLSQIELSENNKFFGAIIAINKEKNGTNKKVIIKINKNCEVNGLIYSSDFLHLEGKINANVFAEKLLLKTTSSVYENHLMNCEINPKKFANTLAIPRIFDNQDLICSKRIN